MHKVSHGMSRSHSRDVIYNNISVGVASKLYLFPEMEADCSRTFFVSFKQGGRRTETKLWV